MIQQGQVFKLKLNRGGGSALWPTDIAWLAGARSACSVAGFASERDAAEALARARASATRAASIALADARGAGR